MKLETARLVLRQPVEEHFDQWCSFDADPLATRFFGGPKSRAVAWEMFSSAAGMWALRGCGLFSVFEKNTHRWIGRIGPWIPEGATAEVGYAILPAYWGKGYATEGARAAIDWVVDRQNWKQINHCIDAGNTASIAVAHRLGAKWLREDLDAHGEKTQVYGQTAEQWKKTR